MNDATPITIPTDLKPADGRFGAGPSKIPAGAPDALAATKKLFDSTWTSPEPP